MANKRYPGSPNIAKLVNKAIQNQDWKKTECLPLSDYPLRPNERDTLHKLAVGDTTLTVFLGKRGNPPTEKYITLDAKEFPKKLISKLLDDDHDGKLNDVASMRIEADVDIDGEPVKMTLIHTLPDEDERKWYLP